MWKLCLGAGWFPWRRPAAVATDHRRLSHCCLSVWRALVSCLLGPQGAPQQQFVHLQVENAARHLSGIYPQDKHVHCRIGSKVTQHENQRNPAGRRQGEGKPASFVVGVHAASKHVARPAEETVLHRQQAVVLLLVPPPQ